MKTFLAVFFFASQVFALPPVYKEGFISGNFGQFKEIATPSSPPAGYVDFYAKSGDRLYEKNSSGTESKILAGQADLTAEVSGQLPPANGGTGLSTITAHGVMIGEGTSNVAPTAAGSAGQALLSGGSSADPAWSTPTYPSASGSAGKILRSDGTNNVYSSTTWPNALTGGGLLYASSATNVASTGVLGVNTILLGGGSGQQPNTLATDASTTKSLISGGTDTAPSWGVPGATGGGTAQTTWTTGDILYASNTNTLSKLALGSANQVLTVSGTSPAWATVAAGTNYAASNPGAEVDVSGWINYADAADVKPVDCTGGSPATAVTRSASSPLAGTGSFTWSKSANNRQGEGTSFAFSIDSYAQGHVINLSMPYTVSSGTYVDGDMTLWIYDVTNSTLIQPSGSSLLNIATGLAGLKVAQFQAASNSTSYRACWHTSSTSASAYTLKWDNVTISPQTVSYGTADTDWVQYTPTFTGFGTTTSVSMWSRRAGDSLMIAGTFTTGTVTGVTAKMTIGYNGANANVTMDSTKLATAPSVGFVSLSGAGVPMGTVLDLPGTNTLEFGYQTSTTGGLNAIAASSLVGNTTSVSVFATIPIAGWSSSTVMSSDTDTRVVAAKYTGALSSTIPSSATVVVFGTKIIDTHGGMNASTGSYSVQVPGVYKVCENIPIVAAGTLTRYDTHIRQNTVNKNTLFITPAINSVSGASSCTLINAVAGDTIDVTINYSGTTGGTFTDTQDIDIERISGPASIAASETVAARYSTTNAQAISQGVTAVITTLTKEYDTHSGMNPSSGVYSVPTPGYYHTDCATISNPVAQTVGSSKFVLGQISGTHLMSGQISLVWASIITYLGTLVSGTAHYNAGDTISCSVINQAGSTYTLDGQAGDNWISIQKVGNF